LRKIEDFRFFAGRKQPLENAVSPEFSAVGSGFAQNTGF
jgi:hypothetical protein